MFARNTTYILFNFFLENSCKYLTRTLLLRRTTDLYPTKRNYRRTRTSTISSSYMTFNTVRTNTKQYGLTDKECFFRPLPQKMCTKPLVFLIPGMRFLMLFNPEIKGNISYYLTFLSIGAKLEVGSRLCLWFLFGYRMVAPQPKIEDAYSTCQRVR